VAARDRALCRKLRRNRGGTPRRGPVLRLRAVGVPHLRIQTAAARPRPTCELDCTEGAVPGLRRADQLALPRIRDRRIVGRARGCGECSRGCARVGDLSPGLVVIDVGIDRCSGLPFARLSDAVPRGCRTRRGGALSARCAAGSTDWARCWVQCLCFGRDRLPTPARARGVGPRRLEVDGGDWRVGWLAGASGGRHARLGRSARRIARAARVPFGAFLCLAAWAVWLGLV
jgi:hypothetical protein